MPVHPWNKEFTWQSPPGPYRRISEAQATQWNEGGYFLLEDALPVELLAEIEAAIDPFEGASVEWLRSKGGSMFIADADAITFTTHLVTKDDALRAFAAHDVFADLTHDLIGEDTRLYWDQAVYKKPETAREFPWHQDNGYTFVEPQQYLTCWVPLVDATVDNGCPWVAPGRHLHGTLEHWLTPIGFQCLDDATDAAAVEAPVGSVVVFSSLTPHRTGPNLTDATRKAYILQYAPDGALALKGQPPAPPQERIAQDDPDRQFVILRRGDRPR
jgi:ectoine hydroxylase-related dioxygenase (phytanoyl-CoA dioxygenase family)